MNNTFYQVYKGVRSKYLKLKFRLDKSITTGQFKKYSRRKQHQLIRKVEHLRKRVLQLHMQLKLAAAGATLSLFLNGTPAQAQTQLGPFNSNTINNPLHPPLPEMRNPVPVFADLDGDGDQDMIVGVQGSYWSSYDQLKYFKNIGSKEKAVFEEIPANDPDYPFTSASSAIPQQKTSWVPAFGDIDGDGDLDLLIGTDETKYGNYGTTYYFKNIGSATSPNFEQQTGTFVPDLGNPGNSTGNPFDGFITYRNAHPTFVDLDHDGDMDLLLSGYYGEATYGYLIQYFENTGTTTNPNFVSNSSISLMDYAVVNDNSRNGYSYDGTLVYASPTSFADLDEDGDLDFFFTVNGQIIYLRNDGTSAPGDSGDFENTEYDATQEGEWVPNAGNPGSSMGNPFDPINQSIEFRQNNFTSVGFVDLDNDGDLDVVLGQDLRYIYTEYRSLVYYENKGQGVFEPVTGLESPVDGVDVGGYSHVSFADIDNDGDMDALTSGNFFFEKCPDGCYSYVNDYLNVFENNAGVYKDITNTTKNKFSGLEFKESGKPQLDDVNGDGLLDIIVPYSFLNGSEYEARVQYFENVAGSYIERTGADNPFDFISEIDGSISLDIADLDGDANPDLVLNTGYGSFLQLFKNIGSTSQPEFLYKPEWEPADDAGYNDQLRPTLVDVDHDGDLDIVLGKYSYMWYFENTGDATTPSFTNYYENDIDNPFGNLYPREGAPTLFDLDGDGDLDLFIGNRDGQFEFYQNDNLAPTTSLTDSPLSYTNLPVVIDGALTLDDEDGDMIVRATIRILNHAPNQDDLTFITQNPVTGNYDKITGILTLSGKASASVYQDILRSVKYEYKGSLAGGRKGGRVKVTNKQIEFRVYDSDFTTPNAKVRIIAVPVDNQPPAISANSLSTLIGGKVTLNLSDIISDPDENLDPNSFQIVPNVSPTPLTKGEASLTDGLLTVDYTGLSFTGTDFVTIQACDFDESCATAEIAIEVAGDIVVYNGISPNGDGKNDFLFIRYIDLLSPQNKVSIFNRWGDKVFELEGYNNDNRRFEGKSDSGKDLPGGVYFYVIEQTDRPKVTGYLTIK